MSPLSNKIAGNSIILSFSKVYKNLFNASSFSNYNVGISCYVIIVDYINLIFSEEKIFEYFCSIDFINVKLQFSWTFKDLGRGSF